MKIKRVMVMTLLASWSLLVAMPAVVYAAGPIQAAPITTPSTPAGKVPVLSGPNPETQCTTKHDSRTFGAQNHPYTDKPFGVFPNPDQDQITVKSPVYKNQDTSTEPSDYQRQRDYQNDMKQIRQITSDKPS